MHLPKSKLMKYYLTALALLISLGFIAQVKTLKTEEEARLLSKKVTELFKNDQCSKGLSELENYWPLPGDEIDNLKEKTIKYMNLLKERFGDVIGYAKGTEQKIADFSIREVYFIKYQNSAIRLIYIYYRNNDGWLVNSFKWDDNYKEEFR